MRYSYERFPAYPLCEVLLEKFLKPTGVSQYRLAKDINAPAMRISKICNGNSGISADTVLRMARYFSTPVNFWIGIQTHDETELVKMNLCDRIEREVKVLECVS